MSGTQKFGFIGTGHAGSRFVDTLLKISDKAYPALAINTAASDLNALNEIALNNRIHIQGKDGIDGAGKQPEIGKDALLFHKEKVTNKIKQEFKDVAMIFIAYSSGGGTGRGSAKEIMRIVDELGYSFSVITISPFASEGYQPAINDFTNFKELSEGYAELKNFKGAILLDNQKLVELDRFKHLSIEDFYAESNQLIAKSFHLFTMATQKNKGIEVFDLRDFLTILKSRGFTTIGTLAFNKSEIQNKSIFVDKLQQNLEENLFASGLDLTTSTHAALILFIPRGIIENLDREVLFAPFEKLSEMLNSPTIYKGIYPSKGDTVQLYTLISGMAFPREHVKAVGDKAKSLHSVTKKKVASLKNNDDLFGDMDFDLDSDELELEDNTESLNMGGDFDFDLD